MTPGQLNSRFMRPAGAIHRQSDSPVRRFLGRRAWDATYGLFFATVFVLCQSPASALIIDDIRVLSKLGQPFSAEIVVTPAAGEVLNQGCFTATRATGDLPDIGRVRLALTRNLDTRILNVTSAQPIREPMSEFVLQVKCPGVPTLVKNFLVMIDPPEVSTAAIDNAVSPAASTARRYPASAAATTPLRPRPAAIEPGSPYTVRSGDMLSTIASRVVGRPDWSVWPIAQQIYRNNPGAFLLGDPNVIAEGAVIYIPRLQDVDTSSAATIRPRDAATSESRTPPAPVAQPVARQAQPLPETATPAVARPLARILPSPGPVTAPAQPLPTLQLTTSLLRESQLKIELREQGVPVAPAVASPEPAAALNEPAPESLPDRPDSVATAGRTALQSDPGQQAGTGLSWLWVVVGLLAGLLLGVVAAVVFLRRNLRQEYEHDLREGVHRQLQVDRMRQKRDRPPEAETPSPTVVSPTLELQRPEGPSDHTVEIGSMAGLDFEVPVEPEVPDPTTARMPAVSEDLDLELPVSQETGRTGQHEVDFDLLEKAYSEDYQTEFVDKGLAAGGESPADETTEGEAAKYYHLENRDPADDTPLPIELGDDEMGSDDQEDGDGKIVRFRRGGS